MDEAVERRDEERLGVAMMVLERSEDDETDVAAERRAGGGGGGLLPPTLLLTPPPLLCVKGCGVPGDGEDDEALVSENGSSGADDADADADVELLRERGSYATDRSWLYRRLSGGVGGLRRCCCDGDDDG